MGDVYLALDPALHRQVAVKVLPDAVASEAGRLALFLREARAVSALNHPNILTVYDYGQEAAIHYLVTEYIDGRTLRAWTASVRPPLIDLLGVLRQASMALAAAHAAGIVHRDVKPENLMLRYDGLLKVLDFGIAKLLTPRAAMLDLYASTAPGGQTQSGAILGTVRYMSPEQALGSAVDGRTDVWSLGVVLYELVAGKPPFDGPTPMITLALITDRDPEPLNAAAPGTPEAVCRIVAKALCKQKVERYETAAEMAVALERAGQEIGRGVGFGPQSDVATLTLPTTAHVAARRDEEQPVRPEAPRPTNLPSRVSALIGRARELGEVMALVRESEGRLVTLTGPGGTGKTRLAVEAARLLLPAFADGAFAVDLSTVSDPELIASHIAEVFRLKESADRSLAEELERYLSDKRLLLVLDNFEHLLAGAPFVPGLLAAAEGLRVVATSRERLHLRREREYTVEPLEVPEFSSLPPLEELERAPAVALFVERAREAKASFALTVDNARAVVEVCRRVEGLPLALELAAARVRLLPPAAMLERLEHRLKLLTGGARDLPSRHQTMRGAVAWSFELLGEEEKAVLRRLAVFAGGATLEAAEAVCGWGKIDVLEAVESLVDKSLLRQREIANDEMRFTMLEVVREYAIEQLSASDEVAEARLAHARWFRGLAAEAAPDLWGAEQSVWVGRLAREYDNLKAALSTMLEQEPEEGGAFVADLSRYWSARCHYSEARGWYTRALETAAATALRVKLLISLSDCERRLGDVAAGLPRAREAVEASRASEDSHLLVRALHVLGQGYLRSNELAGAREAFEEALAIAHEVGDDPCEWGCLNGLGEAARRTGDGRTARAFYEQALEAPAHHSPPDNKCINLLNLGGVSLDEGDVAGAAPYYREALAIGSALGSQDICADAMDGLAAVALEAGEHARAARLAGAAEALHDAAGIPQQLMERALRERTVAGLRASLDAETLEREWSRGRVMTLAEATRMALDE